MDDNASQWQSETFYPAIPKTPEPIVTKIYVGDNVGTPTPYPCAKFYYDSITRPPPRPRRAKMRTSDSASFPNVQRSNCVPFCITNVTYGTIWRLKASRLHKTQVQNAL